mgnify:FL=1
METNRANVTLPISELLEEGLVREGDQGVQKVRGRKPTFLYLNSQNTVAVAVDVRASRTFIMVTDSLGKQIGEILSFATKFEPTEFIASLSWQIRKAISLHAKGSICSGIGIVIPGVLDQRSGLVLHAPTLRWHNVRLLEGLQKSLKASTSILRTQERRVLYRKSGRSAATPGRTISFLSVYRTASVSVL